MKLMMRSKSSRDRKKNTYKIRQMKKRKLRQLKMVKLQLMKVRAPQLHRMILIRDLIKVKSQRRMLQLQRTRPKQSRTKDHRKLQHHLQRRMKNLPGMFFYLMVIAFYVLTMDIWLRNVKFLTGTIIIYKTLEVSLHNHETGSTMILSKENMGYMGHILNVSNAITMAIVLVVVDIKWNRLWTTLMLQVS